MNKDKVFTITKLNECREKVVKEIPQDKEVLMITNSLHIS